MIDEKGRLRVGGQSQPSAKKAGGQEPAVEASVKERPLCNSSLSNPSILSLTRSTAYPYECVCAYIRACMHARVCACVHAHLLGSVSTAASWSLIFYLGPYCTSGHIAQVAILHMWPYCTRGRIAQKAILRRWPYCTGGHTAQIAILHRQTHRTGGRSYCADSLIAQVTT